MSDDTPTMRSIRESYRLGCTDHGCVWGHPGGMGTGGGCKCLWHMSAVQAGRAGAAIHALRTRLAALERVREAGLKWKSIDDHDSIDCTGEEGCALCHAENELFDALAAVPAKREGGE